MAIEFTGSFKELVGSPRNVGKVTIGFELAIAASFAIDGGTMTTDEVKRRFQFCEKIFKQLRGDLSWGIERIIDHLAKYLRYELDGVSWEPDKRTTWMASDGH
jgi:hypothetical protein